MAEALNVGRTKVFDLIRCGQLASVKVGGSRRITEQCLKPVDVDVREGRTFPVIE